LGIPWIRAFWEFWIGTGADSICGVQRAPPPTTH